MLFLFVFNGSEITDQYIYMVMECGNIDLNSWLKKKKSVNPWERKSYWKNMLEAVYTIHQHGILKSLLCKVKIFINSVILEKYTYNFKILVIVTFRLNKLNI